MLDLIKQQFDSLVKDQFLMRVQPLTSELADVQACSTSSPAAEESDLSPVLDGNSSLYLLPSLLPLPPPPLSCIFSPLHTLYHAPLIALSFFPPLPTPPSSLPSLPSILISSHPPPHLITDSM